MIENLFLIIILMQIFLAAYILVHRFREKKLEASQKKDLLQIVRLEKEIGFLKNELQKLKTSYAVATNALAQLQKKKSDISEGLMRQKDAYGAANTDLEKLKQESAQLKNALLVKEQALENINSQTSVLEKELSEKDNLLQTQEQLNKEMAAKVTELQSSIEQLKNEIANKEKEAQDKVQLEIQMDSLKAELEKIRSNYSTTQNSLKELSKKKSDINQDLRKQKDSYESEKIELERFKKESSQLKDTLLLKEQELEKTAQQTQILEKHLGEKNNLIGLLENQNKEILHKQETLKLRIEELEQDHKKQGSLIAELKTKEESIQIAEKEELEQKEKIEAERIKKKQKIGEILLENNFITPEILDKALEAQNKTGDPITKFLLTHGYVDESKIAQCLCTQFGFPYLPLNAYQVLPQIIKLLPVDIAEKYFMIPVDKVGNILTVVMADPLNTKAIKEVEEITGLKIQIFTSLLSEIIDALELYYNITLKGRDGKDKGAAPFFIDTKTYGGPERRDSLRYKTKIEMNFSEPSQLRTTQTIDISRSGFLFEIEHTIPIGTLLTFQINLPTEVSPLPITALARVVRVIHLPNDKFQLGVRIIKISEQELNTIIGYAATHAQV